MLLDKLWEYLPWDTFGARAEGVPPRVDDPFFILHDSRSGSTFLADLLIRHTGVAIPPESNVLPRVLKKCRADPIATRRELRRVIRVVFQEDKFRDWALPRVGVYTALRGGVPMDRAEFFARLFGLWRARHAPDTPRFGIKKGSYALNHRAITGMFPAARFIPIVRDGRAVFASKSRHVESKTGEPFETDPRRAAAQWAAMVGLMREVGSLNPGRTRFVHYEELVADPPEVLRGLAEFLGVPFHEKPLHVPGYVVPGRYGEQLHANVGKPPSPSRVNAWKDSLAPEDVRAYEEVAGETLRAEGYELTHA